MARKIDRDDYIWMGDHHFNGSVTGINGGGTGAVESVNGQTGEVVLTAADVNAATVDDIDQAISDLSLGSAAQSSSTDFATAAQGALADTAVQPGDLPAAPTWTTISGKPAFVAEGANAAAARTALGLGSAATTAASAYATAAQGELADSALQNITGLIEDGTNVTITGTGTSADPYVISASGGGGGGGQVDSVSAGTGISVDSSNPESPEVSLSAGTQASLGLADSAVQPAALSSGLAEKLDVGTGTQDATTYRRGDGTWATPPNTTYSAITQANAQNPASTTVGLVTGQRLAEAFEGRIVAVSSSKSLALTDRLTYQNVTAASTLTVPANADVAFPVGSLIQGFGQTVSVTFAAASGVTIYSDDDLLSTKPNTAWSLKKVATDSWHLIGSLQ